MQKCENCGASFELCDLKLERIAHTELDGNPVETVYTPVCPHCGSEDICCDCEPDTEGEG